MRYMNPSPRAGHGARSAFTLIEILIVVVILGILAAIVVPKYTDASNKTNDSSCRRTLQIVRHQIEYYRARNIAEPDLLNNQWSDLVQSDLLHTTPVNPWNNSSTIAGAAGGGVGWIWRDNGFGVMQLFATDSSFAEWIE